MNHNIRVKISIFSYPGPPLSGSTLASSLSTWPSQTSSCVLPPSPSPHSMLSMDTGCLGKLSAKFYQLFRYTCAFTVQCSGGAIVMQVVSVMVSGLSLSGIALDRYKAVTINKSKNILPTIFVIGSIDFFAVLMAFPYSLNIKVRKFKREDDNILLSCLVVSPRWVRSVHGRMDWGVSEGVWLSSSHISVLHSHLCQHCGVQQDQHVPEEPHKVHHQYYKGC